MRKKIISMILVGILILIITGCGKDDAEKTNDGSVRDRKKDKTSSVSTSDSVSKNEENTSEADTQPVSHDDRVPAVAAEDMHPKLFYASLTGDGASGTVDDLYAYVAWDDDGSNIRVVFVGKASNGVIPITEMDRNKYYGSTEGEFRLDGKAYNNIEAEFRTNTSGVTGLSLKADGEELNYHFNFAYYIKPFPSEFWGVVQGVWGYTMTVTGDRYIPAVVVDNTERTLTLDKVVFGASEWNDDNFGIRVVNNLNYVNKRGHVDMWIEMYDDSCYIQFTGMDENNRADLSLSEFDARFYYNQ